MKLDDINIIHDKKSETLKVFYQKKFIAEVGNKYFIESLLELYKGKDLREYFKWWI